MGELHSKALSKKKLQAEMMKKVEEKKEKDAIEKRKKIAAKLELKKKKAAAAKSAELNKKLFQNGKIVIKVAKEQASKMAVKLKTSSEKTAKGLAASQKSLKDTEDKADKLVQ